MNTPVKLSLVLLSIFSVLSGCKDEEPTPESGCMNAKVLQIQQEAVRNPPGSVWQYMYNGQIVYYIPSYCCDQFSELYDAQCRLICNPDGGFTGQGNGGCTDFFTTRTNERLVWQDNR